jgi:hypothetical protein
LLEKETCPPLGTGETRAVSVVLAPSATGLAEDASRVPVFDAFGCGGAVVAVVVVVALVVVVVEGAGEVLVYSLISSTDHQYVLVDVKFTST